MTTAETLVALAGRCEAATGANNALNREVALACGWHRYSPSEIHKSNPGWIAPEDFIGEHVRKDGRRSPILDSLHGTSIWREPRNYLASLDAAMTLCGDDEITELLNDAMEAVSTGGWHDGKYRETLTCYLVAAALRSRAALLQAEAGK